MIQTSRSIELKAELEKTKAHHNRMLAKNRQTKMMLAMQERESKDRIRTIQNELDHEIESNMTPEYREMILRKRDLEYELRDISRAIKAVEIEG